MKIGSNPTYHWAIIVQEHKHKIKRMMIRPSREWIKNRCMGGRGENASISGGCLWLLLCYFESMTWLVFFLVNDKRRKSVELFSSFFFFFYNR